MQILSIISNQSFVICKVQFEEYSYRFKSQIYFMQYFESMKIINDDKKMNLSIK